MEEIRFSPIGIVHSPFTTPREAPRQPHFSAGAEGSITVFPEYMDGLKDLEGFSHIVLLCHLHLITGYSLDVTPGWDGERRGLFATRTPRRPNPIGMSVVRLTNIDGTTVHIRDIDMVDGTPLLDIKPYVPPLDEEEQPRFGWMEHAPLRPFDSTRRATDEPH
ncbi:MAG: tRNA (N6-threonylcarbamoyladenosine(37)-N6)-methyltransferase TrmO [Dehalococcoidia bacterium]|nr:tRNA (N6-threonylcarbamoyladenosine(37)-N6)-methyltransferase TrmO [Dehalococcoidia bacterium]